MLGSIVKVVVDRPMGSCHPNYPDLHYPVNYGYITGTLAADGEEEDAYILGVTTPLHKFTGRVIAVINRLDDTEFKWIVAPDGITFTHDQIYEQVCFQEQYFQTEIHIFNEREICR